MHTKGLLINCKLSYANDRAKKEFDTVTLFLPSIVIIPTRFQVGGKINGCFGHVNCEMHFYIQKIKEVVKRESEIHWEKFGRI